MATGVMNPRLAKLWTVQDVATFLGVPVKTIYSWRSTGYGPRARKVGRFLRYDPEEVRRWFDALTDEVA
ncbi:helix-turn-helix transcriptional regulator [Actinomycetospora chibensis]|uniref:Helix-turn-helix transcriptional regulator n=1 Tax=Actinomycetospora chibensis TaxID=663606 RepID=A0ABV9RLC0_9PSEU|nr:helix-turn-helix domain-containing protein [Actinomycetospora chibensis]MDD7923038.1 helix-turn-helix domain-containing protein [Actinomycetospora chibensis]